MVYTESVDIYDENRQFTGITLPREGISLPEGQYMLYVMAVLRNLEGKYLITRRSLDKRWAAGWWEVSGGGVLTGETPAIAVVREVGEEVGLDVSAVTPELIYSYENVDLKHGDNYFMDIFQFTFDFTCDDVTLQEEEAIDCRLASWEEIEELNAQGIFLHFSRLQKALAPKAE